MGSLSHLSKAKDTSARSFGMDLVGDIEWGTHLCQFYKTKKDLIDLLVPYIAEGLRNNEFCMWVTSRPLEAREAKKALRKAIPELDQFIENGQIEVVPYSDWYLSDGEFDADRALQGWVEKEESALDRGFEGLRLTGNTFWIERKDWRRFADYEAAVNDVIKSHRMIALCSYPLRKCTGSDVVDVVRNHVGALIRKGESWGLVEDVAERKRTEKELRQAKHDWEKTFDSVPDMIAVIDDQYRIVRANQAMAKRLGTTPECCVGLSCFKWVHGTSSPPESCPYSQTLRDGQEHVAKVHEDRLGGDFLVSSSPLKDEYGKIIGAVHVARDITELKKAEEEMTNIAKFPSENPNPILRVARDGTILYSNPAGLPFLNALNCGIGGRAPDKWRSLVTEALTSGARKEFDENYGQNVFAFLAVPIPASGYVNIYGSDVTESRQAEEALRQSAETARQRAEELEKLMDVVPNALWVSRDPLCRVITGNVAANRFYEAEVGENVSAGPATGGEQDLTRRFFQNGRELKPEELPMQESAIKGVEIRNSELDVLLPSGKTITIFGNASPLRDADGRARGCVASFVDITERKRVEQALKESQRDLNRAQAVAKTGSWRLDVQRNELLWSDETHRMFGIPTGTPLTYEGFLDAVHPDDREYVDQKWKAALGGEPYDIEHRIIVHGDVKWVREKAELEFSKDGELLGGFGTVQDFTERRQIEDKLFQSERKYRTLYETTLDGIVSTDMNGHITECNDAYANMLGYSKDELRNTTYQQLTPEKWVPMEEKIISEEIIGRGYSDLYEKEYIRKDGSIFPISIRVWLIRDEKWRPVGMWGIIRDITRSKQLENELKQYSEHLERLVEERTQRLKNAERLATIGETAAMVGHDIRNPLQTVEGAVYIAKEEIKSIPSRTQEINNIEEMLNTIHTETKYVDKIISDLQDYARPLAPELEETDTKRLIDNILSDNPAPQDIEVSVTIEQDCRTITVDPTMMKRTLTNLITNAQQAMLDGGKLTITASRKEGEVHLSVQDTGRGIPDENKAKIFEPLFSTKAKGQGLGLAVVKRLVEAQNGIIRFDSEVGKGTTFTVLIPIAKEAS
jgi:PAS domain S-box-containing protein